MVDRQVHYRHYDRRELDSQYNNRRRFPDYDDHFGRWREWSAQTRRDLPGLLDKAYGKGPSETLDIFPAGRPDAPIHLFIHGGYWQSLDKADFSYVARGMVEHGVTSVVMNYGLAPDFGMDEIVRQTRAAIAWIWRNAESFGGDPKRLYVSGHSAGGHLAAMLLATDWPTAFSGLPADPVKGICAISGIYDLEPIRLCYVNDVLGMDEQTAERNSPTNLSYPVAAPLLIVVGALESDEYRRQTQAMADCWEGLGHPLTTIIAPGLDHFSIIDQLFDPSSELVKEQIRHMENM